MAGGQDIELVEAGGRYVEVEVGRRMPNAAGRNAEPEAGGR